jgi:hypothetical protein
MKLLVMLRKHRDQTQRHVSLAQGWRNFYRVRAQVVHSYKNYFAVPTGFLGIKNKMLEPSVTIGIIRYYRYYYILTL